MQTSVWLCAQWSQFETASERPIEIAVPYEQPAATCRIVEYAAVLARGLDARVSLVAVHTVPYPAPLGCPGAVRAFLEERLMELCMRSPLPAEARIVVARSFTDGLRQALQPESIVLLATPRRIWRTREERLARALAREGYRVNLFHLGQ